jgi:hypothetical protein
MVCCLIQSFKCGSLFVILRFVKLRFGGLGFMLMSFGNSSQALPNQHTVDYPSFKLVLVGDGGTGNVSHFARFSCHSFHFNF